MRKIIIYLFIFLNGWVMGENSDSLKLAFKTANHDTTRCNILKLLASFSPNEEQMGYTDELKLLVEKNLALNPVQPFKRNYTKHLAFLMRKYAIFYYAQGDYSKGLDYFLKGLKLSEELGDKIQVGRTLGNIAVGYHMQSNHKKSLEYFLKALKLGEELGDKIQMSKALNNIANLFKDEADFPKALEYYFKGLKISEEIGDKQQIGMTTGNIATVFESQNDYPKALEYYKKGLKISEETGDQQQTSLALTNIGGVYSRLADHLTALEYYFKGLKLMEEVGDKHSAAMTLSNIGVAYKQQSDYPKALEYYLKGLKMSEELGDKNQISITLGNSGDLYMTMGKYTEAENFLKRALLISREIGIKDWEQRQHASLSYLFEKTNRPGLALQHFKQFIALRDSIYSHENSKKLMRSEMDRDYEQKAQQLKYEQDKKDIQANEEKKKQKIITYSVSAGLILVLLLAVFVFRSYRQKRKANLIITQQKHEVEESKKAIVDSILYAKRIQKAMMPADKYMDKNLSRLQKKK